MLLKIFVKKKAQGELCTNEFEWTETLSQATEILKKETENGFEFCLNSVEGSTNRLYCPTQTHGFEISNDAGVVIERFVTAVN